MPLSSSLPGQQPVIRQPPLLKWPGGKRRLLAHIIPLLPRKFNRYYEPFAGGAALFFALTPQTATLADANQDLISCYKQIQGYPEAVISELMQLKNTKEDYFIIRSTVPHTEAAKAARMIYLSLLSFNGIYRLNQRGEFNVPYSGRMHINPCDADKIRSIGNALINVNLLSDDFEAVLGDASQGDLVYLDPPYTVTHGNNGFLKYNAKIFSWCDQMRLALLAKSLSEKGCHVVVSNADHHSIHRLYNGFKVKVIERNSVMAAMSKNRGRITECIFHNIDGV